MTGPWMANFLEDFRGFMAKYWIVQPATDTEYALDFDASAASPESFLRLRNRKTGETADPEGCC